MGSTQSMGGSHSNMMESMKSNMMTMLMLNNMNSKGGTEGGQDKNMFTMIYVFLATSVVDFIFKNAPHVFTFLMKKYTDKLESIKKDLDSTTKDLTDNKVKKKTASITVTINVNAPESVLGQSLLDFITNNKNTTHVSYIRESFILNQKDVITIDDEVFARMTQSTSADQGGIGSTSTNNGSGAGPGGSQNSIVQVIEIYSFTKTTDELRTFLDDIKQKYTVNVKNKLGNKRYYFNMHPLMAPMDIDKHKDLSRLPPNFSFIMKHFQTNRKFSNLFGEDIDAIRNRVNFFVKNRKWYDEKGIPYTLGLLLSGSPGTGKTSTIKCLANETNRHICNVNLNNDMTKTQLENLFFNENIQVMNPSTGQVETYCIPLDQRIYVLEDVDCQSDIVMERALKNDSGEENEKKRDAFAKEMEDKHKVDLSFLLNLLDGVLENPGRIVIMTSNFPDTLDSALIRPGRIDVIAKFRNCSNKTVKEMVEFFYDIQLSGEEMERISQLKEEIVTPAELSKVMFENFSDYQASIQHMENLSSKRVEEEISRMQEQSLPEPITVYGEPTSSLTLRKDGGFQSEVGETYSGEQSSKPYNDSNAQTVTVSYSNKEVGFSEQKGDVTPSRCFAENVGGNERESENKFTTVRRRIEEDITYVFINIIVDRNVKREKINRKWEDYNYYSNLLQTYIFKLDEYVNLVGDCASKCKEVVEHADNLKTQKESPNIKAISRNNIVIYESKLYQFFNPTLMTRTGLRDQLVKDGMIDSTDRGEGFQYAFDSQLNSSSLNTSSYSAY